MESYIPISFLNDFIFCPRSIYFHQLYGRINKRLYQTTDQISGSFAHKSIDEGKYSTSSKILQNYEVYSHTLNVGGKIDIFDIENQLIIERKRKIITIYDGYIFQMYAQYYALVDMGYYVKKMKLYSLSDNKSYWIDSPLENEVMSEKFKNLLKQIRTFKLDSPFSQNIKKCNRCIYNKLCDFFPC